MATPLSLSLKYHTNRLDCDEGYNELDLRVASIRFKLTQIRAVVDSQTRPVRIGDRSYCIWSPNSTRAPFYPGPIRSDFFPTTPVNSTSRRYDGHVGRHDNIYGPQYRRLEAAHWPFMRRATSVDARDDLAPAFANLSQCWEDVPGLPSRGRFTSGYLRAVRALNAKLDDAMLEVKERWNPSVEIWDARPTVASLITVQMLEQVGSWDEAVDLGMAVQRGLREKDAWCKYIAVWGGSRFTPIEELLYVRHTPADDRLIGVWLNGMEESPAVRYLAAGVPCFVIHEYRRGSVDTCWHDPALERRDFLQDTDMARLVGERNPYQKLARRLGLAGLRSRDSEGSFVGPLPAGGNPDYSSLSYVRDYTRTVHIRASSPPRIARMAVQISPPPAKTIAGPSSHTQRTSVDPARSSPQTLERRVLDVQRHPWVVPPPILVAPQGQKWTDWISDKWEESTAWICVGRKQEITMKSKWFDRSRNRRLHFGHFSTMPGVLDWQTFGAPVPQFPFMHPDGQGGAVPKTRSVWMYPMEKPEKGTKGCTMVQPDAQRLPLLTPRESSDPLDVGAPMDTEPTATQADEESEDDNVGGMDLDDPEARDSSTRSVVIDGLSVESSTSSFYDRTRSLFFRAGVSPVKVAWFEGRMWVLMKDRNEGQRAIGALAGLQGDRRISFGEEGDCLHAIEESSDVWAGIDAGADAVGPVTASSSQAITTSPEAESFEALRVEAPSETVPLVAVPTSTDVDMTSGATAPDRPGVSLPANLQTRGSTDASEEVPREAPRSPQAPLSLPSAPPPVEDQPTEAEGAQHLGDEGIFQLFAPSLRALTRRPSSPIRQPPSAPRAMILAATLPAPLAPPALASRLADPIPSGSRVGRPEGHTAHARPRLSPPRPALLDHLSDEAPVPPLAHFSTPPPVDGPSLLSRMGAYIPEAASSTKRPRSPSPSPEAPVTSLTPAPKRAARRGMRGREAARQLRAQRVRLLALEQAATPSENAMASTPSAQLTRTSPSARLQPPSRVTPSASHLSEMDQALLEADWTLSQAERAAPLEHMDWDMEDDTQAWNDPSM
ncbi:hypothetical protein GGX14DRAFT_575907 [Mycena pura]|uniref:Uncharacterized protein n=1 Tax=Mycena pura TaxID=153505 RepID=A0AAD6UY07_9AGAR|nr:hypothetical protein GGX14DRAFT_575907 [Mycena pura]